MRGWLRLLPMGREHGALLGALKRNRCRDQRRGQRLAAKERREMKVCTIARVVAWLLLAVMIALTVGPPRMRPVTWLPHSLEHFFAFAAVGVAFGLGYARHRLAIAFACAPCLAALELSQLLVAGRHATRIDLFVNIG